VSVQLVFILGDAYSAQGKIGDSLGFRFGGPNTSGGRTNVLGRKLTWSLMSIAAAAIAVVAAVTILGLAASERASANQCGANCRNAYNQCRISTKGSSSCEAAFTRCMQSCIRK